MPPPSTAMVAPVAALRMNSRRSKRDRTAGDFSFMGDILSGSREFPIEKARVQPFTGGTNMGDIGRVSAFWLPERDSESGPPFSARLRERPGNPKKQASGWLGRGLLRRRRSSRDAQSAHGPR